MTEQLISVERMDHVLALFGNFDTNIKLVEEKYGVKIILRGTDIKVAGEPEQVIAASKAIEALISLLNSGEALNDQNIHYVMDLVDEGQEQKVSQLSDDVVCITAKGKPIKAKTVGQQKYMKAIAKNTVTLGVGISTYEFWDNINIQSITAAIPDLEFIS